MYGYVYAYMYTYAHRCIVHYVYKMCVYIILHIYKKFSGKQKILGTDLVNPREKIVRILKPQSWACHWLINDCESSLKNFVCFRIITGFK